MDRMLACEAGDPGSIPGESTIQKKLPLLGAFYVWYWTETRRNFSSIKTKVLAFKKSWDGCIFAGFIFKICPILFLQIPDLLLQSQYRLFHIGI